MLESREILVGFSSAICVFSILIAIFFAHKRLAKRRAENERTRRKLRHQLGSPELLIWDPNFDENDYMRKSSCDCSRNARGPYKPTSCACKQCLILPKGLKVKPVIPMKTFSSNVKATMFSQDPMDV